MFWPHVQMYTCTCSDSNIAHLRLTNLSEVWESELVHRNVQHLRVVVHNASIYLLQVVVLLCMCVCVCVCVRVCACVRVHGGGGMGAYSV